MVMVTVKTGPIKPPASGLAPHILTRVRIRTVPYCSTRKGDNPNPAREWAAHKVAPETTGRSERCNHPPL